MSDGATCLYRMYDEHERLLYVGITSRMSNRVSEHRLYKDWWQDVSKITISRYDQRDTALAAEAEAIRAEEPAHNQAGTRLAVTVKPKVRAPARTKPSVPRQSLSARPVSTDICLKGWRPGSDQPAATYLLFGQGAEAMRLEWCGHSGCPDPFEWDL